VSIRSFADDGTRDVYNGVDSRDARRTCPANLLRVARRKLDQLDSVTRLHDLRVPPGNRLKELEGDRKGEHAIRINDQYRVCFRWTADGPEDVKIEDYH
jgi:proteic killer suppression protein